MQRAPRITISISAPQNNLDGELLTLDLPPGLTVADLKGFVQADTNVPTASQQFYLNGQPVVGDTKTVEEAGIKDGEMLAMLVRQPGQAQARRQRQQQGGQPAASSGATEIENVRLRTLGNPQALNQLAAQVPELAEAVNDRDRFRQVWETMKREEDERARERELQIRLLNEDPFNVDAQRKIEEMIRKDQVMENAAHAMEHTPEVYGTVSMLYINAEVNGHPVKAFVDSGAQATIMSPSCAEACNIMRLIDTRYSGIAKGVGTAKILGRVHSAVIKIGSAEMPCSFMVMEGKDVDLLLGLDMLKRHQACIDLRKNKLVFPHDEVDFLPESEIPKYMAEAQAKEPTIPGPDGTEIGTQTGAVRPAGSTAASGASTTTDGATSSNASSSDPGQTVFQPTPGQPAAPAAQSFPQASIDQLQSLGFSREEALAALNATEGDVEYAAGLLYQG
ncbi:hypothetical protein B0A49_04042 [Cryomyces minteri]|uniref:DNA damage-inducible protein 1 n=1 Tax=Cryomyces minteri TaxID=331657 RepID=A0A4U0WZL8_9PEZI|nr:hypothetical protein B0A49_04042 [Cryomyces minteri]